MLLTSSHSCFSLLQSSFITISQVSVAVLGLLGFVPCREIRDYRAIVRWSLTREMRAGVWWQLLEKRLPKEP